MNTALFFSFLSGVLILSGYIVYNHGIFLGTCRPNAVSWAVWTMTSTLNLMSYFVITNDLLKVGMSAVSTLACLLTFIFLLGKKSYAPLSLIEKITLAIGIISALAWWQFHSAVSGNLILQTAIIAGFISTYRSIWKNPSEESLFAWTLFTLAYASLAITVVLCGNGSLPELIYPFLGLFLHFTSAFLILIRKWSERLDIINQVVYYQCQVHHRPPSNKPIEGYSMKGRDKQRGSKGKKPLLTPEEKRRQKRERKHEKKQTTGERVKEQLAH